MQLAAVFVYHVLLQHFHNNLASYFNFSLAARQLFYNNRSGPLSLKFVETCSTASSHLALVLPFGRFVTSYIYFEIRNACSFAS